MSNSCKHFIRISSKMVRITIFFFLSVFSIIHNTYEIQIHVPNFHCYICKIQISWANIHSHLSEERKSYEKEEEEKNCNHDDLKTFICLQHQISILLAKRHAYSCDIDQGSTITYRSSFIFFSTDLFFNINPFHFFLVLYNF